MARLTPAAAEALGTWRPTAGNPACGCYRCTQERIDREPWLKTSVLPLRSQIMFLCGICGNKRCPHAADHRLACTDSNEPGQAGSLYEHAWRPTASPIPARVDPLRWSDLAPVHPSPRSAVILSPAESTAPLAVETDDGEGRLPVGWRVITIFALTATSWAAVAAVCAAVF